MNIFNLSLLSLVVLILSACSSNTLKVRQEQREKLAVSTGMYCDFVSGDMYPDIEVELSLQMARRCDAGKNFTMTQFRNSSNHNGVLYCCHSTRTEKKNLPAPTPRRATPADKTDGDIVEAP